MEEAEKRSERLRAMRMQADQATGSQATESSLGVPSGLVNPLNASSASLPSPPAAARFDYYTDPMAAYSRKGQVRHQVPQDYHTPPRPRIDTTSTPAYRGNPYPQGPGSYQNSHFNTSTQTTTPFRIPQVNPPGVCSRPNAYPPPGQSMFQPPEMYGGPAMGGRPMQTSPYGTPPMNPPGVFSGSSSPSNQYFSSNLSGGPNFHSPQRGGSPNFNYGRGRGQRYNDSPRPGHGGNSFQAGRGRNNSFGSGPPQSHRGERSGSHNNISAEVRPDRFYNKSMVEDPWKMLKPVLWKPRDAFSKNIGIFHKYQKSSTPSSIKEKKARLTDDSNTSTPEPSLSEYLAASLNEAIDHNESS